MSVSFQWNLVLFVFGEWPLTVMAHSGSTRSDVGEDGIGAKEQQGNEDSF
jgi:hypothetical protein